MTCLAEKISQQKTEKGIRKALLFAKEQIEANNGELLCCFTIHQDDSVSCRGDVYAFHNIEEFKNQKKKCLEMIKIAIMMRL